MDTNNAHNTHLASAPATTALDASNLDEAAATRTDALDSLDPLAHLRADPLGAATAMMEANNILVEDRAAGPVIDRITRPAPGRLMRNTHIAARPTAIKDHPTRASIIGLIVAEAIAHNALDYGFPTDLAAQATLLKAVVAQIVRTDLAKDIDARHRHDAEAAARNVLARHQVANLTFASTRTRDAWAADQTETDNPDANPDADALDSDGRDDTDSTEARRDLTAHAVFGRPRVLWAHPDGPSSGLLIDRLHSGHLHGILENGTWTRRKVASDLRRLARLLSHDTDIDLANAVLGVRVIGHRAEDAVHYTATLSTHGTVRIAGYHRVGDCENCLCAPDPTNTHLAATGHWTTTTPGAVTTTAVAEAFAAHGMSL